MSEKNNLNLDFSLIFRSPSSEAFRQFNSLLNKVQEVGKNIIGLSEE